MSKMQMVRRVCSILDFYTNDKIGNVSYGNYPMVAIEGKKIRLFNLSRNRVCRLGWLIPIGVPYVVKKRRLDEVDDEGERRRQVVNIAYQFGEKLYVHDMYYQANLGGPDKKKLYSPAVDKVIQLTKGGWEIDEQEDYSKFIWQYALKTTIGDFRKVANINFEMAMSIDTEMLAKIGWTVNQVLGRNAFYGIVTTGTKPVGRSKKNLKYKWYNKYLCALDITGGNGLEVWGYEECNNMQHPHIGERGQLCRGDFAREIQERIDKGLITEFFVLMLDFLEHYNPDSPLLRIPVSRNDADESRGRYKSTSKYLKSKIVFGEER
jgi:hypothetical protein